MNGPESLASSSCLEILWQDEHLVAINKPSGLLVHRSRVDVTADVFAVQKLRDQIGRFVYPIHRIDRPTSGVLLFALNSETARLMSQQFSDRKVQKTYLAIVRGHASEAGRWDEALVEKQDRTTDSKAKEGKLAQDAVTEYRRLNAWTVPFSTGKYPHSRYSLVEARPLTGRKHQLRRHFNHMAHPIVGDTTYGDRRHNRLIRERSGVCRLMLVAKQLVFTHPVSGQVMELSAECGADFDAALMWLNENSLQNDCLE